MLLSDWILRSVFISCRSAAGCSMSSGVTTRATATRPPPPGCRGTRSPKPPRPQAPASSSSSYTSAGPPSSSPGTSSSTSSSMPSPSTSTSPPTSVPISCSPAGPSAALPYSLSSPFLPFSLLPLQLNCLLTHLFLIAEKIIKKIPHFAAICCFVAVHAYYVVVKHSAAHK